MDLSENTRLEITNESLPHKFQNEIAENGDIVTIRSNIKSMTDVNEWVKEFGVRTNTKWNSRTSYPSAERFVCSKKFVCHHSSFNKVPSSENKKGKSKNAECLASVTVKVKLNTTNTRKNDEYIKKGLVGVITITPFHKHSLMTAETSRFLPAEDNKLMFEDYINDGMENFNFDAKSSSTSESLLITASHLPENSIQADNNYRKKELSEKLLDLLGNGFEKFDASETALEMAVKRLEKISSEGQWETMLATLGSNVPLEENAEVAIKVEPTSIAQKSIGVTKGIKRLSCDRPFNEFHVVKIERI